MSNLRPEDISPEHRAMIREADQHAALVHAQRIGTPQGLRNLFPTNLIRQRVRRINPTPIQEKHMTPKKPHRQEPQVGESSTPSSNAAQAQENIQREAGMEEDGTVTPRGEGPAPAPRPHGLGRNVDPGPPPAFPAYAGDTRAGVPVQIDQLLLAGQARDREAANAVSTLNVPPHVGQYKAAVLQWLDDMDVYENATVNMPRGVPRSEGDANAPGSRQDDADDTEQPR